MTSRERITRIFSGRPADRVGCFEQTIACSVASEILGRPALTGGTGLQYREACAAWEGRGAHEAFVSQLIDDTIEIADVLGFDMIRPRGPTLAGPPTARVDEHTFAFGSKKDGTERIMRFDPEAETWGTVKAPEKGTDLRALVRGLETYLETATGESIEKEFSFLDTFVARAGRDRPILDGNGHVVIPMHEDALMACVTEPDLVAKYLDCQVERAIMRMPFAKKHGADIIWAGGDLADNRGPLYGPRVFREILLPRLKRVVRACHKLDLPYVFRTDGNLWCIADEFFAESGIDGYGEIDIEAGMDLRRIRDRFPRTVLCGNVSCSSVLHLGTVDDVIRATRTCIDKARGGGHVVGSSNSIVHGTSPENVLAMFETARSYGTTE